MPDKRPRRKLQDPEVVRLLAASLLAGATLSEALEVVGVSESTYYRELRRTPELQNALDLKGDRTKRVAPVAEAATGDAKATGKGQKSLRRPAKAEPVPVKTPSEPKRERSSRRTRAGQGAAATAKQEAEKPPRHAGRRSDAKEPPAAKRSRKREQPAAPAEQLTVPLIVAPPVPATPPAAAPPPAAATAVAEAPTSAVTADVTPVLQPRRVSRLVRDPYTIDRAVASRRATRRPAVQPLSGADWMPPMAVLVLQLIVAVAVGASLAVIGLIAVTCLLVFVVVIRTSRRAMPSSSQPTILGEPAGDAEHGPDDPTTNGRPMDLTWVASSILKSGKPPNDRSLPPRS